MTTNIYNNNNLIPSNRIASTTSLLLHALERYINDWDDDAQGMRTQGCVAQGCVAQGVRGDAL